MDLENEFTYVSLRANECLFWLSKMNVPSREWIVVYKSHDFSNWLIHTYICQIIRSYNLQLPRYLVYQQITSQGNNLFSFHRSFKVRWKINWCLNGWEQLALMDNAVINLVIHTNNKYVGMVLNYVTVSLWQTSCSILTVNGLWKSSGNAHWSREPTIHCDWSKPNSYLNQPITKG